MTSKTPDLESLPIIFDNTVLSNFALVQAFGLLPLLYKGRAFIGQAVLQEIQAGIESGWQYPHLRSRNRLQTINHGLQKGWIQLPNSEGDPENDILELKRAVEYGQQLGAGEAEAMAIARTRH